MTAKITLITVTLLLLRCCTNLQYLEIQFLTFVCLSVFSPNSDKIHGSSSLIQTNIPHLETNSISTRVSWFRSARPLIRRSSTQPGFCWPVELRKCANISDSKNSDLYWPVQLDQDHIARYLLSSAESAHQQHIGDRDKVSNLRSSTYEHCLWPFLITCLVVYFHLSEAWVLCTIDNRLNIATIIWSLCSFRQRSGRMQVMQLRFYLISFFVLSIKCFPTDPWSWSWCLQELRNRRAEEPVPGDQPQPAGAAAQDPDPGRESRALSSPTPSFTSMAPRPRHLKLLVTTHHQGNICYTYIIFHTIFLSVVTVARMLSNTALFLYNDNIQSPMYPVPTASGPCVADVTLLAVGKL